MDFTPRHVLQRRAVKARARRAGITFIDNTQFEMFYACTVDRFVQEKSIEVVKLDESGTPILDAIFEFFKWLYESGAFAELIKLFFGVAMTTDVVPFTLFEDMAE